MLVVPKQPILSHVKTLPFAHPLFLPCFCSVFALFLLCFCSVFLKSELKYITMSSNIFQGLQSFFENPSVETHILMNKSASDLFHPLPWPEPQNQENEKNSQTEKNNGNNFDYSDCKNQQKGGNFCGWSSIQSLTNISDSTRQGNETEQVYVHPLVKDSSSTLSTKSLEMCTESLGSETGSIMTENIDEFPFMVIEKQSIDQDLRSKSPRFSKKVVNRSVSFPPPLISISGSDGVQFRPHREDGRLVLKAVMVSSCSPCFHAERADGRLRLSCLKDRDLDYDNESIDSEEDTEHEYGGNIEDEEGDDDDENLSEGGCWEDEIKGKDGKIGCEIEVGDYPRPSRCKEGGNGKKGMNNWEPFWVAIS